MIEYVIYGKNNCTYCEKAKALLNQKNINFTYLVLGEHYSREDLLYMLPDAKTLPQIFVANGASSTYIGGFTELETSFKNEVEVLLNSGHTLEVTFTKTDGTERVMLCTRNPEVISEFYTTPESTGEKKERKQAEGVLAVFDLDKNSWRSFRLDSIIGYAIVEEI